MKINLAENKISKGEKTKELAILSAIHCIAKLGYGETTFQAIADHSKLSQPLVVHYFKKKENVFPMVINYLIKMAQEVHVTSELSATQDLKDYLTAAIKIFRLAPNTARVYFTLTYLAVFKDCYKNSYSKIKDVNIRRLADIISKGIERNEFSSGSILLKAQMINCFIAGILVDLLVLESVSTDEEILELLHQSSLSILNKTHLQENKTSEKSLLEK